MAVTFAEEALRALQDSFPIYEALLSTYAATPAPLRGCSALRYPHSQESDPVVQVLLGGNGMARLPPIRD